MPKFFKLIVLAVFLLMSDPVFAQSSPRLQQGYLLGSGEENGAFAGNQDVLSSILSAPTYLASVMGGVVASLDGVHDDNAHDQSAHLQAAINAMPKTGGKLLLPCGNILLKRGIAISTPRITLGSAENQYCSQIVTSSSFLTGDVMTITGAYSGVDGLAFDVAATAAQAASNITAFRKVGYTLNLQNGYGFVKNVSMRGCFVCIELGTYAGHSTVRDATLEYIADGTTNPGSGGIDINNVGSGPDNWLDHVRMQPNLGSTTVYHPSFGVRIQSSSATQMTTVDVTGMMTSLLIAPGGGQAVEATKSVGNFWDGSTGNSIVIQPTGTGFVMHTSFSNDWCTVVGKGANCLTLIGAGASVEQGQAYPIMDTQWMSGFMRSIGGQTGTGLFVADAYSRDTILSHTSIGGWRYGANVAAGAGHVTIDHNIFGIEGVYPGTAQSQENYVGVNVAAGVGDFITIGRNQFPSFTNAALGFAATGANNRVQNNLGYNPVGETTLTPLPSPWTLRAGPTDDDLYINGGSVSSVLLAGPNQSGITVCFSSPCVVHRSPYQTVAISYTTVPTVVQSIR